LPGGGGLTAPYTRSNRPLWLAGFRVVYSVGAVCVLWLLVVFLGPVALQWLRGFGKREVEVRSV
jgi:hypothetical protein